jgi:glycosyltransferase involved in cell wall biosynthesis
MTSYNNVAVLLPCLNEEQAIADVVRRSIASLPGAKVYVYDNASTDRTAQVAEEAGAVVRREPRRGKGNVVRRMFADIDADIYVLLDGDGTYEVEAAPEMIRQLVVDDLDLVTGNRVDNFSDQNTYRSGHRLGNKAFTLALRKIFHSDCEDVLSGYRVMTKRFVKSFPTVSRGFEIEVEMTAHASLLMVPTREFATQYAERPPNSHSKLSTYRDGIRIARALFRIFRSYSPSRFFGTLSLVSSAVAVPFFATHSSAPNRWDSLSFVSGLLLLSLGLILLCVGVILNALSRLRVESLRLAYLSWPR